jgi:hypothetical protein
MNDGKNKENEIKLMIRPSILRQLRELADYTEEQMLQRYGIDVKKFEATKSM